MYKLTRVDKIIWQLESFKANFFHLHRWEVEAMEVCNYYSKNGKYTPDFLYCFECCGALDDGSRFAWRWNPFTLRY